MQSFKKIMFNSMGNFPNKKILVQKKYVNEENKGLS